MGDAPYVFDVSANDALPLEYKLRNRKPLRQVDVCDLINNSSFYRLGRTNEGSLEKQAFYVVGAEVGVSN